MSTLLQQAHPAGRPTAARPAPVPGIPFARLAAVELRKQVDTRAGRWLLAVIVAVSAALIVALLLVGEPADLTWASLASTASFAQILLLPLIGVMAATGEWSQRTALTTFALEPRRTRVHAAKLVSAVVLGLAVTAAALATGAVANLVGLALLDGDGSWSFRWAPIGGLTLGLLLLVTQGVGFGLALLSTPAAIVAYLVLPTAWTVVTALVPALAGPAEWLDMNRTLIPLTAGAMTPHDWARLGTSVAVWVGLPLGFGLWRTARRDVA